MRCALLVLAGCGLKTYEGVLPTDLTFDTGEADTDTDTDTDTDADSDADTDTDTDTDTDADPQGTLLISEVCDPPDTYQARFVEIFNASPASVDLSGWELARYSNRSNQAGGVIDLEGMLPSGSVVVITYDNSYFADEFNRGADLESALVNGNGDDVYELRNGSQPVDIFGVIGAQPNGWDYEDATARRNSNITRGQTSYSSSQWTITPGVSQANPGFR